MKHANMAGSGILKHSKARRTGRFRLSLTLLFACGWLLLSATHQRAGEISYKYISGLTYEFTVTTYTYTPSPADRPELDIDWGDGSVSTVARTGMTDLPDDIRKNVYVARHTFSASGTFHVTLEDPNRNAGIVNIPNSVEVPFFLETVIVINPFLGGNSSPSLMTAPVDNGCTNTVFYHNPGAYDPDGDSLSYSLTACRGYNGEDIPGYSLPQASHSIAIDAATGDLIWDCPTLVGEYNIAILIKEWRNGRMISSMVRDMQITIAACNNRPPVIAANDTCVTAGTFIELPVTVTDNTSEIIKLSATGEPLYLPVSPAEFDDSQGRQPFTAYLQWQTGCDHVRLQPYSVLFKAEDNGPQVPLVSFKTVHITVVAPKPEHLQAAPAGNKVHLSWSPDICPNAVGYDIYRRRGSNPFDPGYCETGIPEGSGYERIGTTTAWDSTAFTDDGSMLPLYHANEYCYRVVALFADGAESYPSDEACAHIADDAPLIINADVVTTDSLHGTVLVRWTRPPEIDSAAFPPPYCYRVYRSAAGSNTSELITPTPVAAQFDTLAIMDHDLDTRNTAYTYQVHFLSSGALTLVEQSDPATTVFLNMAPGDRQLQLSWSVQQPWNNILYTVCRYNEEGHIWDSIGQTTGTDFVDRPLENGGTYCYYVTAKGGYWLPDTIFPLYNRSQQSCGVPCDNRPPELPGLAITTDCTDIIYRWRYASDSADADALTYYFYYKPTLEGGFTCIDSLTLGGGCLLDSCEHRLPGADILVGCFALRVADSNGNTTALSDSVCFDFYECMDYRLPNVFTPNNDDVNDLFTPETPYSGVARIDLYVYNRWGRKVFHTTDPAILWDGTNGFTHRTCPEDVYYYSCDVFVNTLNGGQSRSGTLHGSITLVR